MIEKILDARMPALLGDGVGVVVGIVHHERPEIRGYGQVRHGSPDQPDESTLYEIGSMTKVFTTTLLADQVDRGEVRLNQPARDFLTEAPTLPESITLLSLATHTSGLPRLPGNLWKSLIKDPRDPYAHYRREDLIAYLRSVRGKDLEKTAGRIHYSNLGMGLLGNALSQHLDGSYESAIQQRICEPLGLNDTVITLSSNQKQRLAQARSGSGKPASNIHFPGLPGAGGLLSTCADLVDFLRAYFNPANAMHGRLKSALKVRCTEFVPDMWLLRFYGRIRRFLERDPQPAPEPLGIGLGWLSCRLPKSGARAWMHDGGTMGYRSFMAFVPETHSAVVVLSNRGFTEAELILPRYTIENLGIDLLEALAA